MSCLSITSAKADREVVGRGGSLGLTWFRLVSTWFRLVSFGFTWSHLVSHGFTWFHSVSLGFTWFRLDSLGLARSPLDSLGFAGIHLVSLEFHVGLTWSHLVWFASLGFTWSLSVSLDFSWFHLGLAWSQLVSLGFSWFLLDSLDLTWSPWVSLRSHLVRFTWLAKYQTP